MKTITLITAVVDVFAFSTGLNYPKSQKELFELNEHVKRKQNE